MLMSVSNSYVSVTLQAGENTMENLRPHKILSFVALFFLGLASQLVWVQPSRAQTVEIVHDFGAAGDTADSPQAGLIQGSDGYLYGTTYSGGQYGDGTVFKLLPDGAGFSVIHSFQSGIATNGANPSAGLIQGSDDYLYGTTSGGGENNYGTVFRIMRDGTGFQVIHSFQLGVANDGAAPHAGLIQGGDGYLYGTTSRGGQYDNGTVFKLWLNGDYFRVIKSFQHGIAADGDSPSTGLIQGSDGYLYGTTSGGGANGQGTVFKLLPNGTNFSVIHSFQSGTATDGAQPSAGVIRGIDGYLYGTTLDGGVNNDGTVFKIMPDGTGFQVVRSFHCPSAPGPIPCGLTSELLEAADGYLYGTEYNGGAFLEGTVFRIRPDGSNFSTIDSFACDGDDGCYPDGSLMQFNGSNLYGVTTEGGRYDRGTIFRVNLGFATLTASPTTVLPGASVTANWLGIVNPSAKDWIGLYSAGAANTAFLAWEYVSCNKSPTVAKASGSCPLALPANLQQGSYELRLLSNDSFTPVTASNPIAVTGDGLPTVSITASTATVPENGPGTGAFRVSRTGSTATALVVNYSVGGTAAGGTDYQTLTGSVTIPTGDSAAGITVTPIDDTSYEGPETVVVTLTSSVAYTVGSPNSAVVTILENDSPPSGPTVSVNGGLCDQMGHCFTWGQSMTVTWSGITTPTPRDWFGLYHWRGTNAAFSAWGYVSCTQSPTVAKASGSCGLMVPAHVAPGSYEVRLFSNDSYTLLTKSDLVGIWGPTVSIGPATSSVPENGAPVMLSVGRTGLQWIWQASNSLVVRYTIGGTAANGVDYQLLSGSVTIPAGQSGVDLPITPIDDNLFEGNETLILTIVDGGSSYWGSGSASVTILDNETPPTAPTISGSPNPVTRGSSLTATWSGIVSPTARDWIGLYPSGAPNTAFVAWEYVGCSTIPTMAKAAGSCALTVPANIPTGMYELRLLANDGFNVLAASAPLTVQ